MKKLLLLPLLLITVISFAQEAKKESDNQKTKIDAFTSKTGTIIKFYDYKLSTIKSPTTGGAEAKIRKIISGVNTGYFFQISKPGKYDNKVASIELSDLNEIIKALATLKVEFDKDNAAKPEYVENKFVTSDGFQLGYYVSGEKSSWYLQLERYGTDNAIFPALSEIESVFAAAKAKIDEIKK